MPLPKALQEQVDKATKLHGEVYKNPSPEGSVAQFPGTPQPTQQDVAPAEEPVAEEKTQPVGEPSAVESPPEPKDSEETWEQRYKSYQGRADKSLKELRTENQNLARELETTQYILSTIGQPSAEPGPKTAQQNKPKEVSVPSVDLSPEEIEPYGEDMYKFVRSVADTRMGAMLASMQQENAKLQQQLGNVTNQVTGSQVNQYRAAVQSLIPNYQELIKDPLFIDWLDGVDPVYGFARGYALQDAASKFDANRTAAIINTYLQSQPTTPVESKVPTQLQDSAQKSTDRLDPYIAPGTPRTPVHTSSADAGATEEEGDRVFTSQEVKAFYDDVVRGKFKNNPKRKAQIEQQIHKAMTSGRYKP